MATLLGICGRTGSGKTEFAKRIKTKLTAEGISVGILSMDDFYRELSAEDHERALRNEYDFDCLASFDLAAFHKTILCAKQRQETVLYNGYDHANHKHQSVPTQRAPCDVWIVEGLYLFAAQELLPLFDLKIFMEIDADESLIRRIRRDIVSRRRSVEGVLTQYERYVKPAYEAIVAPSRLYAHICVMRGAHNKQAMDGVLAYTRGKVSAKK